MLSSATIKLPMAAKKVNLKPKNKFGAVEQTNKFETMPIHDDLVALFLSKLPEIRDGDMTYKDFYDNYASNLLIDYEGTFTYDNFYDWCKSVERRVPDDEPESGKTLLERETEKQKQQIEIRQDATDLMEKFLKSIKALSKDRTALAKSGIKVLDIYKIIREEEDRAKALALRERAENRADYAFAFIVSLARANQLTDDDIAFLSDDVKRELNLFKQPNGIFQLPASDPLAELVSATENSNSVADAGNP